MTDEEEQLLTAYLRNTGEITELDDFNGWYAVVRNGSDAGEAEYKETLGLARAWRQGFYQGVAAAQEAEDAPEADRLARRSTRHYHVAAYRRESAPDTPVKGLVALTLTAGYLSRSAANRAAWRDFVSEVTVVRECRQVECTLVKAVKE